MNNKALNNIDDIFNLNILNESVDDNLDDVDIIKESTVPPTDENLPGSENLPKLQETFPEIKIPVPGSGEITASVYNDALGQLQKLIKESSELMQTLANAKIVQESVETLQERFTEEAMENALFESYISGPIFESVGNPNKKEIRKAIKAIIKATPKYTEDDYSLRVFNSLAKDTATVAGAGAIGSTIGSLIGAALVAGSGVSIPGSLIAKTTARSAVQMTAVGGALGAANNLSTKLRENKDFTTRLWQMVGCFNVPEDKLNTALKYYTDMYKDQLGDLVFNAIKLKDGGTKQTGFCYLLILDSEKEKVETIELKVDDDKEEDKK